MVQTLQTNWARQRFSRPEPSALGDHPQVGPSVPDVPSANNVCSSSPLLLIIAAAALGYALDVSGGSYHPLGIACLVVSLLAMFAAVMWRTSPLAGLAQQALIPLLGLTLVAQFALAMCSLPVPEKNFVSGALAEMAQYRSVLAIAAVFAGALLSRRPFLGRAVFPLLVLAFVAQGVWLIQHTRPGIDVFV